MYLTYRYGERLDNCTLGNSIDIHIDSSTLGDTSHISLDGSLILDFYRRIYIFYIADPHEEDKMTADGVMKFLEDLSLNPESRTVLILAWRFKAATQCEFSKDEFMTGMIELRYMYLFSLELIFFFLKGTCIIYKSNCL